MNSHRKSGASFQGDLVGKLVLGQYHIVRKIAVTGMGSVYLARYQGAHGFTKPVVVKIISPGYADEQQFLGMFVREAKILASLQHPGIVEVLDFGQEEDFYVMVLEYVHGFQLREWVKYRHHLGKALSIDVILEITIQMLEALHHAHTLQTQDGEPRAVIHRDISPSNVMLGSDGRLKLVDFGIAHMSNMTDGFKTQSGAFRGKLSYSAPERFGSSTLTAQCDIYSVGVVLHELLTGENEFYTGDHASTIARVLNHTVSSVLLKRPDAPPQLDKIIARALSRDWRQRYASASEFAGELRKMLVQTESAVTAKIAALIQEDFGDDMAAYLGCESLKDRENAWRNPSTHPISPYAEFEGIEIGYTADTTDKARTEAVLPLRNSAVTSSRQMSTIRPVRRDPSHPINVLSGNSSDTTTMRDNLTRPKSAFHRTLPLVIIGLASAAILGIAFVLLYVFVLKPSAPPEQVYLLSDPAFVAPLSEAEQMMLMSDTFQRQQGRVESCMANNEEAPASIDKIYVRFKVAQSGRVTESSVLPAQLKGTALAGCIEEIAWSTEFPTLQTPLSFTIPIAVTRFEP